MNHLNIQRNRPRKLNRRTRIPVDERVLRDVVVKLHSALCTSSSRTFQSLATHFQPIFHHFYLKSIWLMARDRESERAVVVPAVERTPVIQTHDFLISVAHMLSRDSHSVRLTCIRSD